MSPEYYFNIDNELLSEDKLHVVFLANHPLQNESKQNHVYDGQQDFLDNKININV